MKPLHAGFSHRGLECVAPLDVLEAMSSAYVMDHGHKPWTIVRATNGVRDAWQAWEDATRVRNSIKLVDGKAVFT